MLVRYLGTSCSSTPELAAFAASTSKELLSDKMLATILQVHILDCPVHLNVICFVPPIIKFWPKGPLKFQKARNSDTVEFATEVLQSS